MYSNYSWPPLQNLPFNLQQQQHQQILQSFTFPSTSASTTTINENTNQVITNIQHENQRPCINVVDAKNDEQLSKIKPEVPFQFTAASDGIKLEDLKERIKIKVVDEKLFDKFKDVQLEMVITKAGRNLFPKLNFKVDGLEPDNCYLFSLMFKRVNNLKYKYTRSLWIENGPADDEYQPKEYQHILNDRFQNGSQWMDSDISFAKLKLTNNQENPSKNAVVLRSLHKYCPVLIIYRFDPETSTFEKFIEKEITCSTFIAVTAYQNSEVTKLKVDNNPFASGFREGGRKRLRSNTQSEEKENVENVFLPPPAKQRHLFQSNSLFSTPFFANTLNYHQNWYNLNGMISPEQLNNYYNAQAAFQAQNLMFDLQNFSPSNDY
uniref:T-box domain-containing protein n=1 Tax=Panagrolaimus sp. ES5 TaxID=591445 RepID=A0AC34FYY7_9BILA